jgi:hypothetical protein
MSCVDACPVADTLEVKNVFTKKTLNKTLIAVGVILIFISITGIGILTGKWHNNVPKETYLELHKNLETIGHPTSTAEIHELNKESEKEKNHELEKGGTKQN